MLNRTRKPTAQLIRCFNDYLQSSDSLGQAQGTVPTRCCSYVKNGLEEDALVDLSNSLTMPQLILIMSLFTLLISWLVISAYLALRPLPKQHTEQTEHPATPRSTSSPVMQTLTITPRAQGIRTIAQQKSIVTVSADSKHKNIF